MELSKKHLFSMGSEGMAIDRLSLLDSLMEHAPLLISAFDLKGNVLFVNHRFSLLSGPTPQEYVGKNIFDLFPYDIAKRLWDNATCALGAEASLQVEEVMIHKNGSRHVYHSTKFKLTDSIGNIIGTCSISTDITEQKKHEFNACHDFLTELLNRRCMAQVLEADLLRAGVENQHFALALIDLDGFKEVNDSYGHAKGDDILIRVAQTMKESFKEATARCFRIGGDEFAVTFFADSPKAALLRLKKLHTAINGAIEFSLSDSAMKATNSIGVRVVLPNQHVNYHTLLSDVDDLLYAAKREGKNGLYSL